MTLIPELYKCISEKLTAVVAATEWLSLTTDAWSTPQCMDSLLSITAHWIDESWERRVVLIAACPIHGSHTAANIRKLVKDTLQKWNVTNNVHVFLRDNGKNIVVGLHDAGLPSLKCFSHTLQLCMKSGLNSQQAINNALAVCCQLAGHFSHSVLAKESLWPMSSQPYLIYHIIESFKTF